MRTLVVLLLLANLGFLALAQGWLQPYVGLSTQHEREPQRLAAQVHPDTVRVRAAGSAASAAAVVSTGATAGGDCLQAGPFKLEQIEAVEAALAPALHAPTTWQRQPADAAGEGREPQFQLRVEQSDAALREQLQGQVNATPGASLGACTAAR